MKNKPSLWALFLLTTTLTSAQDSSAALAALTPSDYNLKCTTCAHISNSSFYYCTNDDSCRSTPVDNLSCE